MSITADDTCEISHTSDGAIVNFLANYKHTLLLDHWMNLPRKGLYRQVDAHTRYQVSQAIRTRLASLDWMTTHNEELRELIRALRLIHGC